MTPSLSGSARTRADAAWRKPRETSPGLLRYLETIRERIWFVVGITLLTLGVATAYLLSASKVYEAEAELLVTPVADDDPAYTGLPLVRSSSDPTRDVETLARLVTSRVVAADVKRELELDDSAQNLADSVDASPVAQSNVIVVSARDTDPELAAQIANSFARNAIADRNEKLSVEVEPRVDRLREQAAVGGSDAVLAERIARLEELKVGGDPTVRFESSAVAPDSAVSPRPALTLMAGLIGGLVLGLGGAFLMQAVDPRLRREEQLRERYGLPILARIPRERNTAESGRRPGKPTQSVPLGPSSLSPRTLEAYRTLRTMLSAATPSAAATGAGGGKGEGRAIMVTGSSPQEGKTTTAINLASSYALSGKRVILIEADFRHPKISAALRVVPRVGVGDVLLAESSLDEALIRVKPFGEGLRALPAPRPDDQLSELLSMPTAKRLLDQARQLADYVIVDSPPLTEVVDALPLAHCVDDLLVVCRIGTSSLAQLSRLADLLEQNRIEPRGFVVIGVSGSHAGSYYFDSTGRGPELGRDEVPPQEPEEESGESLVRR